MEATLSDFAVGPEQFFRSRKVSFRAVTGRIVKLIMPPCSLNRQQTPLPLRSFVRIRGVANLFNQLSAKSTLVVCAEDSGVVHGVQSGTRCHVRILDALL